MVKTYIFIAFLMVLLGILGAMWITGSIMCLKTDKPAECLDGMNR